MFIECAEEMTDSSMRNEGTRMDEDESGWSKVTYRRSRTTPCVQCTAIGMDLQLWNEDLGKYDREVKTGKLKVVGRKRKNT